MAEPPCTIITIITTIIIIITITCTTWLQRLRPLRLPRNNLELRRDLFVSEFALNSKLSDKVLLESFFVLS